MKNPRTVFDILQLLEGYHRRRLVTYRHLSKSVSDPRARILLQHLNELEEHSVASVEMEIQQMSPEHSTFLTTGPVLTDELTHASDCRCGEDPNFDESLDCVLQADHLLEHLLFRLEGCSAAPSVQELAKRLRDLEETKGRQIANFTRLD